MICDQHSIDTADTFIVFDVTEPLHASLCKGEAEAREIVTYFANQEAVRVHRVTLGELARDVTADFIPDEDEAPEVEFTLRDHSRAMARAGALGR